MRKHLNIEDLPLSVDWLEYADETYEDPKYYWIRYITGPPEKKGGYSQDALDEICKDKRFINSMGELFMKKISSE